MSKPRRDIQPDLRFQEICDFYCQESEKRCGAFVWSGSDGKALKSLLEKQPQFSSQKIIELLKAAFEWADQDKYPFMAGFRFREFAAHYPKVLARSRRPYKQRVTADQIWRVILKHRDLVVGADEGTQRDFWDRIFRRVLNISHKEAAAILNSSADINPKNKTQR